MFLHAENYRSAITQQIAESDQVDIAVAFWGKGAEEFIPDSGKTMRIICNLRTGGTNPSVIEALMERDGIEIRNLDVLHAKLVLTQKTAILGSANFSTNGLNFEGDEELRGWQEAGCWIDAPDQLNAMRKWFDDQWKQSAMITATMLKEAREAWNLRSATRPFDQRRGKRLLDMPVASLAGRNIIAAVWRQKASDYAREVFEARKRDVADEVFARSWTFYEDWFDRLRPDQVVIDVHIGPRNGVYISGPYEIFDETPHTRLIDGEEEKMSLHYGRKLRSLYGIPAAVALAGIKEQIERDPERLLPASAEDSRAIAIEDFIDEIRSF